MFGVCELGIGGISRVRSPRVGHMEESAFLGDGEFVLRRESLVLGRLPFSWYPISWLILRRVLAGARYRKISWFLLPEIFTGAKSLGIILE